MVRTVMELVDVRPVQVDDEVANAIDAALASHEETPLPPMFIGHDFRVRIAPADKTA